MIATSSMNECGAALLILGIIFGAFISEDGATITAATLAALNLLDPRLAFLSAFTGLWAGDLGVYVVSRGMGRALAKNRWVSKWIGNPSGKTAVRIGKDGQLGLALSRFIPGTRLPAYVSAGIRRMPIQNFLTITAFTAIAWVLLMFMLVRIFPLRAAVFQHQAEVTGLISLALFALLSVLRGKIGIVRSWVSLLLERLRRWEFWPAWIFYIPVAGFCALLGIRYRGFALPTAANPSQKNGGIVGESKIEILEALRNASPAYMVKAFPIPAGEENERFKRFCEICNAAGMEFPLVLKPDTGQRGAGFKKIESYDEARSYLANVSVPVVLQDYVYGPKEAGIFYYRFPGNRRGHIFGITRKKFPVVVGDGVRTLRELIEAEPRARLISQTYLKRFKPCADDVLEAGASFRLVEAGNHCQGCIFLDGADLVTESLREAIDKISQKLPGFFVGRYDIRYESDDELRAGRNFKIIELNGAASEATNIYDSSNSIWSAYATLYRQWEIVYRIGAKNRRRGTPTTSLLTVFKDWLAFSSRSVDFPVAD